MHHCCRLGGLVPLMTALFFLSGVFGCATARSTAPASPPPPATAQAAKTAAPAQFQRPVDQGPQGPAMAAYCAPPGKFEFCGEPVPLDNRDTLELFDKEFTLVVYNHAQVYWWLKRQERYLPLVEERLRQLNLPEDLKYVAIAESEPPLNAAGKKKSVDIRYDFELSPDSGLLYLGDLYRNLKRWSCAIAAYNCGEKRIMEESQAQGQRDCYQMMLPPETERYLYRILAIKAVLSDPTRYGYELPKGARNP